MDDERSIHDVMLRRATENDLPSLERLFASGSVLSAGDQRRVDDMLVAEVAETLVGCIGLQALGGDGLLRAACVATEWRERDVGRLLVESALTAGALKALDAVYLFTAGSERFFARFGFLVIHGDDVPSAVRRWAEVNGDEPSGRVAMRVKLIES
jgi:N-acetylglutamate synthase-like GNAT family acetyltransferase